MIGVDDKGDFREWKDHDSYRKVFDPESTHLQIWWVGLRAARNKNTPRVA
jgi:hypothetical protein